MVGVMWGEPPGQSLSRGYFPRSTERNASILTTAAILIPSDERCFCLGGENKRQRGIESTG